MKPPKISVCIPTYNYGRFLPETIESVLDQTFADFELLIIDDCSNDDTHDVVSRYALADDRIRFKVNSTNIGMTNNWNLCLAEAKGDYIKYLFGDDFLASRDALSKMASILDADDDISLVGSSRNIVDIDSRIIQTMVPFKGNAVIDGLEMINLCLKVQKNLIGEPSVVMFRKKDAVRGFNPKYKQIVDLEMWFNLLEHGKFAYICERLASFRSHQNQQTKVNSRHLEALADSFYLYEDYMDKPYLTLSKFYKKYTEYDNVYRIWKFYKKNIITLKQAVNEIESRYSAWLFFIFYPLYKFYRPSIKLYRKCLFKLPF